jgi:oxygen-independent coproporphyrinogen-3 oxidase
VLSIPIPVRFDEISFQIEAPASLHPSVEAAVRSMLPNARFGEGRLLRVSVSHEPKEPIGCEVVLECGPTWQIEDGEILREVYGPGDRTQRVKERVRLGVLKVISSAYDLPMSPWGILTGVRPTKLIHNLLDRGLTHGEIRELLLTVYAVSPERVELVQKVANWQRRFFHSSPNQPVGVYIGIPFCPTRCTYCSFAAYPIGTHGHLMRGFHEALSFEIEAIGRLLKRLGVAVESVYVGGGTPTTFQGEELTALLALAREWFVSPSTVEFTVEAGRPETITPETSEILAEMGVNRVSVNPQTMHDATLKRVGRAHTAEDTRRAVELVRRAGIPVVNMDIILGLPGEGLADVEATLEAIGELRPENLTVHSLAMKRASELRKNIQDSAIAQEQGEAMAHAAARSAQAWGLNPYYLYRQRYILSDLENIGYARPHTASVYNVQMMEERQTIISLGGGGITKLVSPDLRLVRLANPKCPATYAQQLRTVLPAKLWHIHEHFAV